MYVIKTTPEQDKAAVDAGLKEDQKGSINTYPDNCSARSNTMLDAAGVPQAPGPVNPYGPMEMPGPDRSVPGTAGARAEHMKSGLQG